jgi:hypothetical protein
VRADTSEKSCEFRGAIEQKMPASVNCHNVWSVPPQRFY